MNLLHFNSCKSPTYFSHLSGHVEGGVFIEGSITGTTNPMYSYKILNFKYVIHYVW